MEAILKDFLDKIQQQYSGDGSASKSGRSFVQQLRNDSQLAGDISRLTASGQSTPNKSASTRPLPSSVAGRNVYTPRYQPYLRRGAKKRQAKSYDMRLIVLPYNRSLNDKCHLRKFDGSFLMESPIRVMENDQDRAVRSQFLDIIRNRYATYTGNYVYITRPKRTELMKCPAQTLDGKGVYTLKSKSTGNIYNAN